MLLLSLQPSIAHLSSSSSFSFANAISTWRCRPIAITPLPPRTSSLLQVSCKIDVDDAKIERSANKAARRMEKRGIHVDAKTLHQLRKKEMQKARRKARKELKGGAVIAGRENLWETAFRERLADTVAGFPDATQMVVEKDTGFKEQLHGQRDFDGRPSSVESGFKGGGELLAADKGLSSMRSVREVDGRFLSAEWVNPDDVTGLSSSKVENAAHSKKMKRTILQGRDLDEFRKMLLCRRRGELDFFLNDDDVEEDDKCFSGQIISADKEEIYLNWLANQLNTADIRMKRFQFSRLMHRGRLKLTEGRVLKLVQKLGDLGNWRCAMHVVHWVHDRERYQHCKSRYVYTTLLGVLARSRRPTEALNVFNVMRESFFTYPDMAAYHCLAVTLGQAGKLTELLDVVEVLRAGPERKFKDVPLLDWNGRLLPDVIIYNAIINACVPLSQWEGTLWVLEKINQENISPNSATYGLTIEVMVKAKKFDLACKFYQRMEKRGLHPNSHTYKALVEALGSAGKTEAAVELINEMEKRGIVASAGAYFSLACCLCAAGRWQDAIMQVEKIKELSSSKPEVITYTGLIKACKQAGLWKDAISLFNRMQLICAPNIGTLNLMIAIYGKNHLYEDAKSLFEGIKKGRLSPQYLYKNELRLSPDEFTYEAMLGACALAEKWDYFEQVHREMCLRGFQLDEARHSWFINALFKSNKMHLVDGISSKWKSSCHLENLEVGKNLEVNKVQAAS
ncbi:hypothetical protein O6H91_08G067000 [Diphasiastrum complanatum]|uniref:Uncharacterized protein n=3 Tax=Diphasiastrum complanatum TaxID=34168 RepID=A0ACC2CYI1_DIPCM|nr:hypothetical protein O6H91_08G067000 [Diphasiastrum complanatum]KAJ7547060.1 hypothetical protein O6H91_08G067000 [Diphasiastrum complanatum]KAJ7547062.1 hypothetical protein O6H91_08G067000 [Diphasiastrum complanatum]